MAVLKIHHAPTLRNVTRDAALKPRLGSPSLPSAAGWKPANTALATQALVETARSRHIDPGFKAQFEKQAFGHFTPATRLTPAEVAELRSAYHARGAQGARLPVALGTLPKSAATTSLTLSESLASRLATLSKEVEAQVQASALPGERLKVTTLTVASGWNVSIIHVDQRGTYLHALSTVSEQAKRSTIFFPEKTATKLRTFEAALADSLKLNTVFTRQFMSGQWVDDQGRLLVEFASNKETIGSMRLEPHEFIQPANGDVSVLTGSDRRAVTRQPSTLHSSPVRQFANEGSPAVNDRLTLFWEISRVD